MMDTTGMRETAETRARVNRGIWFAALLCGLIGDGRAQTWSQSNGNLFTSSKVVINQATQTPNTLLQIEADGTSGSPGAFPTRGLINFVSWAGSGPSTDNDLALFRFQAARLSASMPNAGNATVFEVCNDDRRILHIRGDGRMGIGTKAPEGMLHLEMDGTYQAPGSFPANGGVKFASWANNGPATDAGKALFFFEAGRLSATDSYAANARIFEVANDDGRIITVRGNGLVGIGKENPQAKLHVGGDLKIDGAIKVASWTVAPDYVFEKDYKMASLQEVESFVQKNKHLPEVPSAKTIKEKGLDLAEMNLLLLKKVEELTLHAIRQEKQMKRQEIEMQRQAEEILGLKARKHSN